jgi:hypothetical protein
MRCLVSELPKWYIGYEGPQIDTLEVPGWQSMWHDGNTISILNLCAMYGVKRLYLGKSFNRCNIGATPCLYSFKLDTIVFEYSCCYFPMNFGSVFKLTQVKTIVVRLGNLTLHITELMKKIMRDFLAEMWFEENYSVTLIVWILGEGADASGELPPVYEFYRSKMESFLERNRVCRKTCQTVAMIFLAKRLKKERQIDPNVCKVIAEMIWETRGTKIWKPTC